ncbi:MAG TPA: SMP-30/gluconolactonase/LRE family protein [Dongiaceae bacterium]|nr:SMP-30/gluconolactonase/LRE family protein [Dongiaceae bacterium]
MSNCNLVAETRDQLGEGPVFVARENALRWVDIVGRRWHRYDLGAGALRTMQLPEGLTSFAPRRKGGFVGTFESGFAFLSDDGKEISWLHRPEAALKDNRFNDGGTDPHGRFLGGSMNKRTSGATGALYRLDGDGRLSVLRSGIGISNTVVFSPDGRTLYFADTATNDLGAYAYDPDNGTLGARKAFAVPGDVPGFPDGSAVDCEGYLWNARWDGGCLVRFSPEGRVDRIVELPVRRPTCCAFGPSGSTTLYVTSAALGLEGDALARQPWAGGLLAVDVGVAGLARPSFEG